MQENAKLGRVRRGSRRLFPGNDSVLMLLGASTVNQSPDDGEVIGVDPPWFEEGFAFGRNQPHGAPIEVDLLELKLRHKLLNRFLLP